MPEQKKLCVKEGKIFLIYVIEKHLIQGKEVFSWMAK